jgi:hypothetical protein
VKGRFTMMPMNAVNTNAISAIVPDQLMIQVSLIRTGYPRDDEKQLQ